MTYRHGIVRDTREPSDQSSAMLVQRRRLQMGEPLLSSALLASRATEEAQATERLSALLERRRSVIDEQTERRRLAAYRFAFAGTDETFGTTELELESALRSIADDADAERIEILKLWFGGLMHDLRHGNLIPAVRVADIDMQELVMREMARAAGGGDAFSGGLTGNRTAEALGKIFAKYEALALEMSNEEGASWTRRPGWLLRGSHDQVKVARAGLAQWRDSILPWLDPATFDNVSDVDTFLETVWENIAAGQHKRTFGVVDAWIPQAEHAPPASPRALIFRSASGWAAYHRRFGGGSVFDALLDGLESAARNIALMRYWGTDPRAAFNSDLAHLGLRDAPLQTRAALEQVAGDAAAPSDVRAAIRARHVQADREAQETARMPSLVTDALGFVATEAAILQHNGVGYLAAIAAVFEALLRGHDADGRRQIADLVGVGIDGLIGHLIRRYAATNGPNGATAKSLDLMFRLDLRHWWEEAQATALALMLSRTLAQLADRNLAEVPEPFRSGLRRRDIDAADWDALRGLDLRETDGRRYLMPDTARQIGGADGTRLERALAIHLCDWTEVQSDTALGEALRFVARLSTTGAVLLQSQVKRADERREATDWQGLAQFIGATIAIGYIRMLASDAREGETEDGNELRDPRDPKTWLAALHQGGGFEIYASVLLSSAERIDVGYRDLEGLVDLLKGRIGERRPSDFPGYTRPADLTNLLYTKMAFDWLIVVNLQEALNPGFLARARRNLKDREGARFWLPLNSYAPRQQQ